MHALPARDTRDRAIARAGDGVAGSHRMRRCQHSTPTRPRLGATQRQFARERGVAAPPSPAWCRYRPARRAARTRDRARRVRQERRACVRRRNVARRAQRASTMPRVLPPHAWANMTSVRGVFRDAERGAVTLERGLHHARQLAAARCASSSAGVGGRANASLHRVRRQRREQRSASSGAVRAAASAETASRHRVPRATSSAIGAPCMNVPRTDFGGAASNFSMPKNDSAKRIGANGEKVARPASWRAARRSRVRQATARGRRCAAGLAARARCRPTDAASSASARHAHKRCICQHRVHRASRPRSSRPGRASRAARRAAPSSSDTRSTMTRVVPVLALRAPSRSAPAAARGASATVISGCELEALVRVEGIGDRVDDVGIELEHDGVEDLAAPRVEHMALRPLAQCPPREIGSDRAALPNASRTRRKLRRPASAAWRRRRRSARAPSV